MGKVGEVLFHLVEVGVDDGWWIVDRGSCGDVWVGRARVDEVWTDGKIWEYTRKLSESDCKATFTSALFLYSKACL